MQPISVKKYNLSRLQYWLDYEFYGLFLYFISFFYGISLFLAVGGALALTPLMLRVLIEQRRFGWLAAFMLFILLPPLVIYIALENRTWFIVALFISLGLYYVFCVLLKTMIPRWLD